MYLSSVIFYFFYHFFLFAPFFLCVYIYIYISFNSSSFYFFLIGELKILHIYIHELNPTWGEVQNISILQLDHAMWATIPNLGQIIQQHMAQSLHFLLKINVQGILFLFNKISAHAIFSFWSPSFHFGPNCLDKMWPNTFIIVFFIYNFHLTS